MSLHWLSVRVRRFYARICARGAATATDDAASQTDDIHEDGAALEDFHLVDLALRSIPSGQDWRECSALDLSTQQLDSIPKAVLHMRRLIELRLYHNDLVHLPGVIGGLTNLRWLYLNFNRLTRLSPAIGQLAQLQYLYLDHNELRDLPREIGNLQQLKELYLNNNQLQCLPASIGRLSALTYLFLHRNNLEFLPPEIMALERINPNLVFTLNFRRNERPAGPPTKPRINVTPPHLVDLCLTKLARNPRQWRKAVKQLPWNLERRLDRKRVRCSACHRVIIGSPLIENVYERSVFQYHGIPIRTLLCSTRCAHRPAMQRYFGDEEDPATLLA
mmetsp:Transcript_39734/g.100104  ORF Transcript_39734/g.100104 Transcript_39734/m.100104 type:complete len:332 (+) Transcript_39734:145-1140(+)|eukprot:CAMPEP_0177670162 /NCGR_PEP_ID=MMETSP0447-20121125/23915_1 /TAXON_ID=0 /ORGANISM="Stygamoeba regulata, Strain BSH-02190019" /LENGTH=331 /DNA_ID=CAMNT_0019177253 /DNA_START=99 /DNA_END=1094 /DNA_ORIENTATION=-